MTRPQHDNTETLEFQLSLLRLAEIAATNRGANPGTAHIAELEQLKELVPVRRKKEQLYKRLERIG